MTPQVESRSCDRHGPYESTQWISSRWSPCPRCANESAAAAAAAEAARKRQYQVRELLNRSGLDGRFLDVDFESYAADTPAQRKVLAACRAYAASFNKLTRESLWLIGPPGVGKTHLMSALVRAVIEQQVLRARITTPQHVVRRLRATWRRDARESEEDVLSDFWSDRLLVLDEVGVGGATDSELAQLFEVVDGRYVRERPTALVSNLSRPQLQQALGARLVDRLCERAEIHTMNWTSHRGKVGHRDGT